MQAIKAVLAVLLWVTSIGMLLSGSSDVLDANPEAGVTSGCMVWFAAVIGILPLVVIVLFKGGKHVSVAPKTFHR